MGNTYSSSTRSKSNEENTDPIEFKNLLEVVDFIATDYILSMDFQSLLKMSDPEHCNELVVLTSDIFNKFFDDFELSYLKDRTLNGDTNSHDIEHKKVSFITKEKLKNIEERFHTKKTQVCSEIAKFYVKIAHIFATRFGTYSKLRRIVFVFIYNSKYS